MAGRPLRVSLEIFDDGLGDGPSLFAGGQIDYAGKHSSHNIARLIGCAGSITGDLDGDGDVDGDDLEALLSDWGPCPPEPCPADLNGDGVVSTADLLILLGSWGANAGTGIDFDRLPEGDVVSNQFPAAWFSSSAGNVNFVHDHPGHTPPNIICTGPIGGSVNCLEDTFIDFLRGTGHSKKNREHKSQQAR